MRNHILSILIATGVLLSVFGLSHLIKDETDGAAFASINTEGLEVEGGYKSSSFPARKNLQKALGGNADSLLSLVGQDVLALLKAPELVRSEGVTTVWQYRNRSCVLDLYFSASKEDAPSEPVAHYEIRAREKGVADEDVRKSCVRDVMKQQNGFRMVDVSSIYKVASE